MIPIEWTPDVPMERVIFHWTAGTYEPNERERRSYHFLIDGRARVHRGVPVELNSRRLGRGYAAHTLNANTGSIGVSLCGMGGAQERPYSAGRWPLRQVQLDVLVHVLRVLGERYHIPVGRRTMLSHAEVQPALGISQRAKWDIAVLPFRTDIQGAVPIGDMIRAKVGEAEESVADSGHSMPAGAIARVTSADNLNTRRGPKGKSSAPCRPAPPSRSSDNRRPGWKSARPRASPAG